MVACCQCPLSFRSTRPLITLYKVPWQQVLNLLGLGVGSWSGTSGASDVLEDSSGKVGWDWFHEACQTLLMGIPYDRDIIFCISIDLLYAQVLSPIGGQ